MSEDSDPGRTGCLMKFKVFSSALGVVAGCVACPVFAFVYGNLDAALWAGFSVIIASMVFQLHMLYKNHRLESWHTGHSLAATRNLGLLATCAGLAGAIYYFYIHWSSGEAMLPIMTNNMVRGVWAGMCVKWGVALGYYGHKYKLLLDREYSLI